MDLNAIKKRLGESLHKPDQTTMVGVIIKTVILETLSR